MDNRTIEKRYSNLELRSDDKKISGYAAVFYNGNPDTEYKLWQGCKERIGKDAFRNLIQSDDDVIVSFNHDMVTLLGRRSAGTCRISIDDIGLRFECDFDAADPDHVRVSRKIQKKEVTGCSFAFTTNSDSWTEEGSEKVRTLNDVNVYEVGPVIFAAYSGTSVGIRSEGNDVEARSSFENFETEKLLKQIQEIDSNIV